MTRPLALALTALLATACEKGGGGDKAGEGEPTPAPPTGPLRVVFGDCAGPSARFESGPRPQPFDLEEVEAEAARPTAGPPEEAADEDEAPPEPDPMDEGKMGMGKKERAEGRYKMQNKGVDPQLARKQALEEARNAGILGTMLQGGGDLSSGPDEAQRTGFGSAGGTGWGTIGTGRYGTIGTHGGFGPGGGGMPGRRAGAPLVRIGAAESTGDLDKNIIRRYIRRNLPRIEYCYEKQLLIDAGLAGTVTASFTITPQGTVTGSKAEGVSPKVATCVAEVIGVIVFPKPKDGRPVQVTYPFSFRPTGDEPATGPAGTAPAPAAPPVAAYEPGRDNPLRPQAAAITDCLRQAGQSHGAAVIEIDVDASGSITASRAHGIGDQAAACVATAARAATWAGASARTYRCPIAFGTLDPGAAPGVDITTEAVLRGKDRLADVRAIVGDAAPEWKIAALYERLRDERTRQDGARDLVAITGPLIIRPVDQAPMRVVSRVLMTAMAADADAVLAARRGGTWKPLRAVELPVVPVPRGTGGHWSDAGGKARDAFAALTEEPPVVASILVTRDSIWVGLTTGDLAQIKDTAAGHDWAALASMLGERKRGPFFLERTDIEIGADDLVPYGDVVKVIDAATEAGFLGWMVIAPEALSVRFRP